MLIAGFPAGPWGTNCYVVATGPREECVVVDPGGEEAGETTMGDGDNITQWIGGLKAGDQEAARRLWESYFHRLVRLVERKLPAQARRAFDARQPREARKCCLLMDHWQCDCKRR